MAVTRQWPHAVDRARTFRPPRRRVRIHGRPMSSSGAAFYRNHQLQTCLATLTVCTAHRTVCGRAEGLLPSEPRRAWPEALRRTLCSGFPSPNLGPWSTEHDSQFLEEVRPRVYAHIRPPRPAAAADHTPQYALERPRSTARPHGGRSRDSKDTQAQAPQRIAECARQIVVSVLVGCSWSHERTRPSTLTQH